MTNINHSHSCHSEPSSAGGEYVLSSATRSERDILNTCLQAVWRRGANRQSSKLHKLSTNKAGRIISQRHAFYYFFSRLQDLEGTGISWSGGMVRCGRETGSGARGSNTCETDVECGRGEGGKLMREERGRGGSEATPGNCTLILSLIFSSLLPSPLMVNKETGRKRFV